MSDEAPQRLRQERERLGLSQKAFGELGGVSKNTQLAYENGSSQFSIDYLTKLASHGLDIGFVTTGRRFGDGDADSGQVGNPRAAYRADRLVRAEMVDVAEIDLRFGLGGEYMDEVPVPQMRSFSRDWLRQITTSPPEHLYWAKGQGNSMEPTISDGDILLIDRTQATPAFGDLYWAIAFGHVGMIKRLRPMPDGSVKILSDNPSVPPETAVDEELHVFGRVVAVVKKV